MEEYRRRERRTRRVKWCCQLSSILLVLAAWEIGGRLNTTHLFPPFLKTLSSIFSNIASGELISALLESLQSFIIGFGLAAGVGLSIGLLAGRYRRFEHFIDVYVNILLSTPILIFVPLFVVILGIGLASRVAVVFTYSVIIILVNTMAGVKGVGRDLIEMAQSFGSTERQIFFKVMLPGALPLIVSGLRLGVSRAFIGMVFGDIVMAAVGIGYLIMKQGAQFKAADLFGSTLTVIVLAVLVNYTLNWATGKYSRKRQESE